MFSNCGAKVLPFWNDVYKKIRRTNKNLQLPNNKAIASLFCAQVLKPDYFTQSEIAISTKKSYKFAAVVPNFLAVRCLKVRMPTAE